MAKTIYLTVAAASTHLGTNNAKLNAATSWWTPLALSESRGADTTGTAVTATVTTVAGATPGVELLRSSLPAEWISAPLSADFTISGTITLNLWASESSNSANTAINAAIDKIDRTTGALTRIATSVRVTELTTSAAAVNFTVTPTSTACNRGDRLRVRVFADDAGTMGSGFTITLWFDRSTAAQGESFVTFTETLTFETTPSGSTYYTLKTISTVNPGSASERNASMTNTDTGTAGQAVAASVTGPTAPIQLTAGGSPVEWYTPALDAFTLGGQAKFNIYGSESNASADGSLQAEIAVVDNDGTNPAVWGIANIEAVANAGLGELSVSSSTGSLVVAWVAGDDTSVTAGQRLRFRLYANDCADAPLATGFSVYGYYGGAAAGNQASYVILPQTVTEQATTTPIPDVNMALAVT